MANTIVTPSPQSIRVNGADHVPKASERVRSRRSSLSANLVPVPWGNLDKATQLLRDVRNLALLVAMSCEGETASPYQAATQVIYDKAEQIDALLKLDRDEDEDEA
jgi:hypothetical protein